MTHFILNKDIWIYILSFIVDNFNLSFHNLILNIIPFNEYTYFVLKSKTKYIQSLNDISLFQHLVNCSFIQSIFYLKKNKFNIYKATLDFNLSPKELDYLRNVIIVMEEVNCSIHCANYALIKKNFDLVDAIMLIDYIWPELYTESQDYIWPELYSESEVGKILRIMINTKYDER